MYRNPKARSRTNDSIFAGYLEEFSVGKMNDYPLGFSLNRDNLDLRAIGLIVDDLYMLLLLSSRCINGNRHLLGLVIQIGTKHRILR